MRYLISSALLLSLAGSFAPAMANQARINAIGATQSVVPSVTTTFAPRPTAETQIDYEVWDTLLKEIVLYNGPSLRQRSARPEPVTGSRFTRGHTSPYRMEGNRVMFEGLNRQFDGILDEYVEDLVSVGNRVDIPSLPRNEQLAYWLNLHNALAVQGVQAEYPTGNPSRTRGEDGLKFHDSKRVTIDGVPLSLRDIRESIVYANWRNPMVVYGFFHGDIGGPSMQRKAFTADNVWATLKFSGEEYANSLRGFHVDGRRPQVSKIYRDASVYMFEDFRRDLGNHFSDVMYPEIRSEFTAAEGEIAIMSYDTDTADLTNGDFGWKPSSQVLVNGSGATKSYTLQRALEERTEKMKEIRSRGLLGSVVIEDIETVDPEASSNSGIIIVEDDEAVD